MPIAVVSYNPPPPTRFIFASTLSNGLVQQRTNSSPNFVRGDFSRRRVLLTRPPPDSGRRAWHRKPVTRKRNDLPRRAYFVKVGTRKSFEGKLRKSLKIFAFKEPSSSLLPSHFNFLLPSLKLFFLLLFPFYLPYFFLPILPAVLHSSFYFPFFSFHPVLLSREVFSSCSRAVPRQRNRREVLPNPTSQEAATENHFPLCRSRFESGISDPIFASYREGE